MHAHRMTPRTLAALGLGVLCSSLLLLVSACGTAPPVKMVATATPKTLGHGSVRSLQVSRVYYDIPKGTQVGHTYAGAICRPLEPLRMDSEPRSRPMIDFADRLRKELEAAGFPLVQSDNKLFLDDADVPAELLLGALIKELQVSTCSKPIAFATGGEAKGGVYMRVEWQLLAVRERKVVYTATTEGTYTAPEFVPLKEFRPFNEAFAAAVRNLLADAGFCAQLVRSAAPF